MKIYHVTTTDFFGGGESRAFWDLEEAKEWGEEYTLDMIGDWTGSEEFPFTIQLIDVASILDMSSASDVLDLVDDFSEYSTDEIQCSVKGPNLDVSDIVGDVQEIVATKLNLRKRYGELRTFWGGYLQLPGFQLRIKDHTANPNRLGSRDLSFVISGNNMGAFSGGDIQIFDPSEYSTDEIVEYVLKIVYMKINELLQGYLDEVDREELELLKQEYEI